MSPDVSVIIPAYNAELTIRRAVRSALNQDGVEVEVCVVDDSSTDDTVRELERMPAGAVKWTSQKPNGGVAAALNAAAEMATAPYIQVLAGDDWLEMGALARIRDALTANPAATFAYGAYKFWGKRSDVYIPPPFEREACYRHNPVAAPMFRREVWDAGVRYRDHAGVAEDWDWLLQVVHERGWQGLAVPDVLVYHYVHASGGLHEKMWRSEAAWQSFKAQWPMVTAVGF